MNGDRGSVSVLGLVVGVGALVVALLIAATGQVVAARTRADLAADAAALAAAPATFRSFGGSGSPWAEADRAASVNGARLTSCDCRADSSYAERVVVVEVAIEVDILGVGTRQVRGTAAAEFTPLDLFDR
ncbi:MAG TPA: hypothetical protein ENH15_02945 [Actinobacteria bacterium]|nr:hypothetical protein [Actinomycetota bacterium]